MDRQKLLIVDDSPQSIKILRHALKDTYDLFSAGDGINALEIASLERPDLILLDVMMPGMDGFKVCQILKKHEELKEIPVLFITSLLDAADEVKGFKVGAADFITKPFSLTVVKQRIKLHLTMKRQKKLLGQKNDILQKEIDEKISELRQKDKTMIAQGRQTAMGEMIGNIAHQWRQPLNALAGLLVNIQQAYQYNELTADYLDGCVKDGGGLIQKMSSTIDDFRNFFLPDKEAVSFSAQNQINQALSLVEAGLKSQNITIHLEAHQDVVLTGFPKEYSQVILNLLSNAGDAVKAKCVLEGLITIRLFKRDGWGCVSIRDNGGGIAVDVIDKIFEPYFSTKKMGTGIGLYMSKMIIERSMNGTIEAHNCDDGAELVVSIPL